MSLQKKCFMSDVLIQVAHGEVRADTIVPGDRVMVRRSGIDSLEPVVWVGRSRIDLSRHAQPEMAAPIRIRAGALANHRPRRDLHLSPEHCLIINGRCIPVKLLVNGGSIRREHRSNPFVYYHLELEQHGALLAEGVEAESFLDTGDRCCFDNADEPRLLHPFFEVAATAERWRTDACAPLAIVPDEVAPLWRHLAERSERLGWQVPTPATVMDPDLHLLVDGRRIQPITDSGSRYVFMLPASATSVLLASRFCIPSDRMIADVRDTRRLGVRVSWISICSVNGERLFPADHPALQSGWSDAERDLHSIWRWTDGAAVIPWANVQGTTIVTVCCTPADPYPIYDEHVHLVA